MRRSKRVLTAGMEAFLLRLLRTPGQTVAGLGYDAFGNLVNHSGKQFDFDRGHRLRAVSYAGQTQEAYRYDAFGRRALAWSPTLGNVRSLYGQDGTLWYQVDDRRRVEVVQVMLNGSRVAEVRTPTTGGAASTRYAHTDALHSAVVETDAAGAVLSRTTYAPFGARLGSTGDDGPGYTGHVEDSTTGLVYSGTRTCPLRACMPCLRRRTRRRNCPA